MKFLLIHVPRRPLWPAWASVLVLAWLVLVCVNVYLSNRFDQQIELCLFKKLTHVPCPTCGITRGVLHALHGRFITAWLCNPLLFSAGALFVVISIMRVGFSRAIRISLSLYERRFVWILAILLILINWVYIIFRVG